jgi:hypothetical protein
MRAKCAASILRLELPWVMCRKLLTTQGLLPRSGLTSDAGNRIARPVTLQQYLGDGASIAPSPKMLFATA